MVSRLAGIIKKVEEYCLNDALYVDKLYFEEDPEHIYVRFDMLSSQGEQKFLSLNTSTGYNNADIDFDEYELCEAYKCVDDDCGLYILSIHDYTDGFDEEEQAVIYIPEEWNNDLTAETVEERELIAA